MIDRGAEAAFVRAIARVGVWVTFRRVTGSPPSATVTGARVQALIRGMRPDTTAVSESGYSASQPGALAQADREVMAMTADLVAAGFPLPLQTGDRIVLDADDGGEALTITQPDPLRRKFAGVVSCQAAGL